MTTIDTEFQKLIPALSGDERAALEASLLAEGCRDALVTWQGVLLDGHNRLEICQRHGIAWCEVEAPSTVTTRDEAMLWILANQMARRNLTREQMTLLLGARYNLEKRQGARTDLTFPQSDGKLRTAERLAVEAGVSKASVERAGKLAEAVEGLPEALKEAIHKGETTMAKARREARRALLGSTPPLPDAKYRVIYADPPWRYGNDIAAAMPGTTMPDDHYPTMTIEELCELPVKALVEDNAVLFLWVTSPLLEECFPVIKAFGFRYKTSYVWDKIKHNFGHYNSVRHEFLLVCTRGACTSDVPTPFDSVITEERGAHSVKPAVMYEIIETLYPYGKRLEMFARTRRPGWDVWGNQATVEPVEDNA